MDVAFSSEAVLIESEPDKAPRGAALVGLLVLAAGHHDRSLGLGARAFHVEPAEAHRNLVAAQDAHALDAARGASRNVGLRNRENCGPKAIVNAPLRH